MAQQSTRIGGVCAATKGSSGGGVGVNVAGVVGRGRGRSRSGGGAFTEQATGWLTESLSVGPAQLAETVGTTRHSAARMCEKALAEEGRGKGGGSRCLSPSSLSHKADGGADTSASHSLSSPSVVAEARRARSATVGGARASASQRARCWRRLLGAAWVAGVLYLVLRGMLRAPEISVCAFIREELGLPCEEHMATTKDGYQLYLKRIPGAAAGRAPVLLLPGVADSAATWVVSGRERSLAGALHSAGFDVWLLEKRGRTPWKHERWSGQDLDFWDFSFDESVDYDVPALVAYVRGLTGMRIASLVGHSEGGTIVMAALAADPELAASVQSAVALGAPLGYGADRTRWPQIPDLVSRNVHPAIPLGFTRLVFTGLCAHLPGLCWGIMCSVSGCSEAWDQQQGDVVGRIFSYYPRETSIKNVKHLIQCHNAGRLQRFDYGAEANRIRYGQDEPRVYDFSRLATPTALFYGTKDRVVPSAALQNTLSLLPSAAVKFVNASLPYGHVDFLWASDALDVLYRPLINFVKEHMRDAPKSDLLGAEPL